MAVKEVRASVANVKEPLEHQAGNLYTGERVAPQRQLKTPEKKTYYPITVTAEDDSGLTDTDSSQVLEVYETNVFPQDFILATPEGEEQRFLRDVQLDLEVGDTNDFELTAPLTDKIWQGYQIYMPDTEYGGLIEECEVHTEESAIYLRGYTWRGLLATKVVEPPSGQDYLVLSGELSEILKKLLGDRFGSLFVVDLSETGITVQNWKVDRYVTLYDAIVKLLTHYGYRINITYKQGDGLKYGAVHLQAVPIKDWSEELEYSQDSRINFIVKDYRRGINHLICLGKGELKDRLVIHLYVQEDGSIGKSRFYKGLQERTAIYELNSEDDPAKLEEDGREKLKELQNYKKIEMAIDDIDVEIGDIVGGRERITGIYLKKPVIRKILNLENGNITIDYKVQGDD